MSHQKKSWLKRSFVLLMIMIFALGNVSFAFAETKPASPSQESEWLSENFNELANGSLPDQWSLIEGTGAVQDGKLVLSSPSSSKPSRVRIPAPKETGDYIFEADLTFQSAVDDSRWASLMYRIQPEGFPYYQFAIRRGATALNGLEFAIRNESNQWHVPETAFYHEPFVLGKTYHVKVIVSDQIVEQYINGKRVIHTDLASQWKTGDLGFQVNGATVQFDNVRVALHPGTLPPVEKKAPLQPKEPQTGIVSPPTLISQIQSIEEINQLESLGVSSVLLKVREGKKGQLVAFHRSTVIASLPDVLRQLNGKHIPIIRIEDPKLVHQVATLLKEMNIDDVQIVSSQPEIVRDLKTQYRVVRGGILYEEESQSQKDLNRIVQEVHAHGAKVVILPQKAITPEITHFFHQRAISVWGMSHKKDLTSTHQLIQTGVNGVITSFPQVITQALSQYPEQTMMQRPVIVAHRGVPSLAPENTMASYRKAYELGADVLETDIQMTKDGHIVIMHDLTVNRTTNGTGAVKSLTLKQIRQLDAGSKFSSEFAGEKVPTFREFLEEFNGKDVVLLVETKATGLEKEMVDMIEELGMTSQVMVQSFDANSVIATHQLQPAIGLGYLYSSSIPATKEAKLEKASQMMHYGNMMNATLNASYGSLYPEFLTFMRQRGLLTYNWTFRNQEPFRQYLASGGTGPITDYTQWVNEAPVSLQPKKKKLTLKVGETVSIEAMMVDRKEVKTNIAANLLAIENGTHVKMEGNQIQALTKGKLTLLATTSYSMLGGEWSLVSEPIEIEIK
ncbi:glycerophosphodiester phosphodiesterase family protein [Hazenella coriacea]|uniref:Glycerophosphoryl diester phosphodiesterase n=1 Tax=Hazenella coriacea TaxID=1179467 RepID=A0A4R3LBI4_9BACL|nr:glycerophosphodiester phosphodiesterase family protein [Hazenella coriacea]TCS94876.1 glycerophosphoryl diester phosphodiesterase [Hazenella coriacea]